MNQRWLRYAATAAAVLLLFGAIVFAALADNAYALTVENGAIVADQSPFAAGESVSLKAEEPPEGKVFYRWVCTAGAFDDAYSANAVFTMPAADATVTASYTEKTRVAVSGVLVADKTYDGQAAAPEGDPASDADTAGTRAIAADGYIYTYLSTDGGGYASAEPPYKAGSYRLIVTVADANGSYFGTSGSIAFTIARRELTVTPSAGQTRCIGEENPAFSFTASGAVQDETPAFTGTLAGEADASAAEGQYAVTAGTLALADNGAFLANNYTLRVAAADYTVAPYETTAVATAAATNLGEGGVYTGDITLTAPEGYTIALSQTGAVFADSVTVPAFNGQSVQHYYLKTASGAVTGTKYIALSCDTVLPAPSLYSPSDNAAVTGAQKIILALNEPAAGVSGKSITIAQGGESFRADAGSGVLVGGVTGGSWYLRYDLSQFAGLTLATDKSYTVSAEAGAFRDTAGNLSEAYSGGGFSTSAESGGVLVVFTFDGQAGLADADGNAIVSGQAVAAGTKLVFPADMGAGMAGSWSFYEEGQAVESLELSNYEAQTDLEAYLTLTAYSMEGAASISGYTGAPRYGEILSAVLTDGAAGLSLTYTWLSGEEIVQSGTESGYTVGAADIGTVIRVRIGAVDRAGYAEAEAPLTERALYALGTPAAPAAAARTTSSITLESVAGMEYRLGDGAWQDSPLFEDLETGGSYRFTRRVKETTLCCASEPSPAATIATYGPLTGTITLEGTLAYGSALTASLTGSNNEGGLSWRWFRGETLICSAASYTPVKEDIGQALTVVAGSTAQGGDIRYTTGNVQKAAYSGAAPAAPAAAGYTGTSVTLIAVDGCEYSLGGEKWQTNVLFEGLAPGTAYSFYQRVRETDTHFCSAASAALRLTTIPSLTGTVYVSGDARFGKTVVAAFEQSNNSGQLTYTWKRGTLTVGTGSSYTIQTVDIGNQLSVVVTSSVQYGSVTRIIGTVLKAEYVGQTPDAPTQLARTSKSLTLTPVANCEYSMDGVVWQSANRFTGLKANTLYSFYQRIAATNTVEASPASKAARLGTSAASSAASSDDGGDTGGGTDDTGANTPLYSLTLSGDDTRILSTTMQNLIRGNQTQDVTIKLENASFTFFKGTMQAIAGQLWYDFGVKINSCIHEQLAGSLAGANYVATIHFSGDGALPAQANIKLWLGVKNAGKTLYYYKLDTETRSLTYMQAAVTDTAGWVTVVQDSCSDYVFCDREVLGQTPSPSPAAESPAPSAEPTAAPADAPAKTGLASGWVLALIICAALLFIIGGVWLYVRSRAE